MGGSDSKSSSYSVPVAGSQTEHVSMIYRNAESHNTIVLPKVWGLSNFFELFQFTCGKFGQRQWLGTRSQSEYEFSSYSQGAVRVLQVANALAALQVSENALGLHAIGILSSSRKELVYVEVACMGTGIISASLDLDEADEALLGKLKQLRLKYICVDQAGLIKILQMRSHEELHEIEYVVCLDPVNESDRKTATDSNLKLVSYKDSKNFDVKFNGSTIDAKSVCMIAFTSGTTGPAKAVRISHENLLGSITSLLHGAFKLSPEDIYISSSHLAEFSEKVMVYVATVSGASIGFSSDLSEDLKILRPTVMFESPRYLDFCHKQIGNDLQFQSAVVRKMFDKAMNRKRVELGKGKDPKKNIWDSVAFNWVRERFGNRLRILIIGSGISSAEILRFFKMTLACEIIESYGSVECGPFVVCSGKDMNFNSLGGPLASYELKLKYLPEVQIEGQNLSTYGELCVRNTSHPLGYLNESFVDEDGWVQTGDIFKLNEESCSFSFVERLDYAIRTKSNWTVLPQRLEHLYRQSPYVAQIIVYGDYRINGLVAIIVPNEAFVLSIWQEQSAKFTEICQNSDFQKRLLKHLSEVALSKALKSYEIIRDLYIEPVPWTSKEWITENLRLRRNQLLVRYQKPIEDMIQRLIIIG